MERSYNNIKKTTSFEVATAKLPPWLFAEVEEFKKQNNLNTRNDALNILIMIAVRSLRRLDEEKCQELIKAHGMDGILLDNVVMSPSKGGF